MKLLSLSTVIISAFVASRARAAGVVVAAAQDGKLYLRQNPLANQNNNVIATSDSDAADFSTTAKWLFTDEAEEVQLSQDQTTTTSGPNWKVSGCCGSYETIFLCCFAAYLVVIKLLWNTFIMKPMKLVAVFVHGKCSIMDIAMFQNFIMTERV